MITIKTYLRSYSESSDYGMVWIWFYINRKKINFSTGIKVLTKHWIESKNQVSKQDAAAADKNLIIENIVARINNVFVKYRLKDKKLTKDAFWKAYNRPNDYSTFFDFIKDHHDKINFKNELSTNNTHKYVISKIQEYAPELHFDDITEDWLDNYYSYLRKDLKNTENTAYKNMSTLRKYVRYAYKKGYMDENPFEAWPIRRTKASYTYLTEGELKTLLKIYRSGQLEHKYHQTLEFFLFMCFSSLHITDARNLRLEQFSENSFTYFRVKNKNKKPEPIVVPVSNSLRQIIQNVVGLRKQGLIFENLPADQTMNKYLKTITMMDCANFNKQISHKTGRHTFATFYLRKTKDLTALKEILGHSELRETLIYAHVLDESKQEGITCFDAFEI